MDRKGICWKAWNTLCRSKVDGGIGFRDFEVSTKLLSNQIWRLHIRKESLFANVFKARYYPKCYVWNAKVGNSPSYD